MVCPGMQTTDCVLGEWAEWSAPAYEHFEDCGNGQRTRYRGIETQASGRGAKGCNGITAEIGKFHLECVGKVGLGVG